MVCVSGHVHRLLSGDRICCCAWAVRARLASARSMRLNMFAGRDCVTTTPTAGLVLGSNRGSRRKKSRDHLYLIYPIALASSADPTIHEPGRYIGPRPSRKIVETHHHAPRCPTLALP